MKENLKKLLIIFVSLFVFTLILLFFHNSKFEKNEYDGICNDIYTEKVWIDSCYFPYFQEGITLASAIKIEVVGIIIIGVTLMYCERSRRFHK